MQIDLQTDVLAGLFDGRLFPTDLDRWTITFFWCRWNGRSHQNAAENMETRYVFFEWERFVPAYDNGAEQTAPYQSGWNNPLLHEVSLLLQHNCYSYNSVYNAHSSNNWHNFDKLMFKTEHKQLTCTNVYNVCGFKSRVNRLYLAHMSRWAQPRALRSYWRLRNYEQTNLLY